MRHRWFFGMITGYRWLARPLLHSSALAPGGCRFSPTCSAYGLEAVRQYGLLRGFMLLLARLARCHPWGNSGYDPLPSASNESVTNKRIHEFVWFDTAHHRHSNIRNKLVIR